MSSSKAAPSPCHILAIPYPGRGHVNPMLNLCRLLVACGDHFSVTVVVTEEWLGLLGSPDLGRRVRFETIPNVIPSEHERAGDMGRFLDAVYTKMTAPFERLLDWLPPPAPAAIVADFVLRWAVDVGERRGVPVCVLCPVSATTFALRCNFHRLPSMAASRGSSIIPVADFAADGTDPSLLIENYIPGLKSIRLGDLGATITNEKWLTRILETFASLRRRAHCVIFSSFHELEGNAIDLVRQDLRCPAYAVGPCIPFMLLQENETKPDDDYMAWLDSQPPCSVLYVSFGSFLSVSAAQLDEIAAGLAESKARILWTVPDAGVRSDVECRLINGRCEASAASGGGVLIVPWTDQLRVLCHPSVGGFFTHCGMNSMLEAVYAGVPMLTLPITSDQPVNSRLVTEVWKIGYGLKEKAHADGLIRRQEITVAVGRLMSLDTAEDEEMRRRAKLLKDAARATVQEGGSSWSDLTSFINFISQ